MGNNEVIVLICIILGVCICVGLASWAFVTVGKTAFENTKTGGAMSFGNLFERVVKVVVVLSVVSAITILGLREAIDKQSIVVILSSLVSFTLGSMSMRESKEKE